MEKYVITNSARVLRYPEYTFVKNVPAITWGRNIGVYSPITNNIYIPNKDEWRVLNAIHKGSPKTILELNGVLEIPLVKIETMVQELARNELIYEEGMVDNISVGYKVSSAQMYVKLTEGCNFACPGCVTASNKIAPSEAKTLDIETLTLYLRSFVRSAYEKGIKSVKIKWAGGEPLLQQAYRLIVDSQKTLFDLKKTYPGEDIEQVILTNGVFIDRVKAIFAKEHDINLSVSLWGTQRIQDFERKPRNKMESYLKIIENLEILEEIDVKYTLNHVITPSNVSNFSEFINSMWDVNHSLYVGKNWRSKHPVPLYIAFYRPQSLYNKITLDNQYSLIENGLRRGFVEIKRIIETGIKIQPLNRIDYLNLSGIVGTPCGSGYNYVAAGPKGVVSCHEALYDMHENLESVKAGINLFDLVNKNQLQERELYLGTNIKFREYEYIGLHGGQGCPRMRKIENNGDLKVEGSITRFYLNILDELLSLECLRQCKAQLIHI